jgi:hypothetical protein
MKIYCDTDCLPSNATPEELAALNALSLNPCLTFMTSHLVNDEAGKTKSEGKRDRLLQEHKAGYPVPNDEKVIGFNAQFSQYGFVGYFSLSDVQDESIRDELVQRGLRQRDAEHVAQAVSNGCDVFLTRDGGIHHRRPWIEKRFPGLKVRRPTELAVVLRLSV